VHRLIEGRRQRFVLLGSSARRLKTAGTNLLAGRAVLKTMLPFVPDELGADFDLERTLRWGALPVIWQAEDPRAALESYAQLYLREEIKGEALVRNLPGFARFLPVAALFHGQTLNVAGLARDSATSRTTVEGYLSILEDTLVWYWAPAEARMTEVDFLLRLGREYLALEVKTRTRVGPEDLMGLRAIAGLRGLVRRVLLYLGSTRQRTDDGIEVWPLDVWLDVMAAGRLWP
jgi:predicted AAA+ superfamily ATPase